MAATNKDPKPKKLTAKERLFCIEYCRNRNNATQAAKKAGYSEKTAGVIGYENLKKPYIAAEIRRLNANFEELAAEMGITKSSVLAEHAKIAYSSIADLHNTWIERKDFDKLTDDQKAAISEISTQVRRVDVGGTEVEVEFVKIKLFSKPDALTAITKMMGWDAATKTEVTGMIINVTKNESQL